MIQKAKMNMVKGWDLSSYQNKLSFPILDKGWFKYNSMRSCAGVLCKHIYIWNLGYMLFLDITNLSTYSNIETKRCRSKTNHEYQRKVLSYIRLHYVDFHIDDFLT